MKSCSMLEQGTCCLRGFGGGRGGRQMKGIEEEDEDEDVDFCGDVDAVWHCKSVLVCTFETLQLFYNVTFKTMQD